MAPQNIVVIVGPLFPFPPFPFPPFPFPPPDPIIVIPDIGAPNVITIPSTPIVIPAPAAPVIITDGADNVAINNEEIASSGTSTAFSSSTAGLSSIFALAGALALSFFAITKGSVRDVGGRRPARVRVRVQPEDFIQNRYDYVEYDENLGREMSTVDSWNSHNSDYPVNEEKSYSYGLSSAWNNVVDKVKKSNLASIVSYPIAKIKRFTRPNRRGEHSHRRRGYHHQRRKYLRRRKRDLTRRYHLENLADTQLNEYDGMMKV